MDIVMKPTSDTSWSLTDRLGRDVGRVARVTDAKFKIEAGKGVLAALSATTYPSLDLVMLEIEKHAKGACQFVAR